VRWGWRTWGGRLGSWGGVGSIREIGDSRGVNPGHYSIYTLAKHMGISVLMLEQHYGHVPLRKKAHQIAGGKSYKD